jgi:hypothetical protein
MIQRIAIMYTKRITRAVHIIESSFYIVDPTLKSIGFV